MDAGNGLESTMAKNCKIIFITTFSLFFVWNFLIFAETKIPANIADSVNSVELKETPNSTNSQKSQKTQKTQETLNSTEDKKSTKTEDSLKQQESQIPLETENSTKTPKSLNSTNNEVTTQLEESAIPSEETKIPAVEYIDLDIEYPEHALILKFHNEFNSDFGKKWLKGVLDTASPYRKYIRQKIEEYGLPKCLEYLPVIESNFNIKAVSKSGAVGLWQFMENSIAGFLTKTTWIDERKDPWLSTDAALKKLQDNYNYFNDWALALAAYNMGLGGLSRLLKNTSCKTYWELLDGGYLKTETKNYVPKFIAISDLITNSEYYGLDLPTFEESESLEFDEVLITKQIGLEQLSAETNISVKEYQKLNPSLTYPVTPYTNKYTLRVPSGQKEHVESCLASMQPLSTDIYVVKKGDTLWGISRRYGITVESICTANNIKESAILRIGTTLFVPIIK